MSYDIRPITDAEFPEYSRVIATVFVEPMTDEDVERWHSMTEMDRTLAAFDGDRIVGTAGAISFQLTLPGLEIVPSAGVTAVTVLPTHRRKGVLRSMMQHQLADVRERGEPLAILLASESIIYGRFGYGLATTQATYEIDPRHGAFTRPFDGPGRVTLVDKDAATAILPRVYDRMRCMQPGALNIGEGRWRSFFEDLERHRRGNSERYYAVYESAPGQVDGYVCWRVKAHWEHGFPDNKLIITQLIATSSEARAALWQFCLGIDLMTSVEADNFPVDEPVRWMLADPRRLRATWMGDYLWARLVDVPSALRSRRYAVEDRIVLDVNDAFLPENAGRYVLEGGPEGAICRRTDEAADLAVGVADLGAAYLGGISFTTLARAGRVSEIESGALHRADVMFESQPAAWCAIGF